MNGISIALVAAVVLIGAFLWRSNVVHAGTLAEGAPAPDFTLPDMHGTSRSLQEFRGQWLLLYFYPKDDTPGCTKEACAFRDGYLELRDKGVQVVGVSLDDSASHQQFAARYKLPFPLLSDLDGAVAARYGALWSLGPVRFAKRHSFLIDPAGRLSRIYRSVDPDTHYRQVLEDLSRLASDDSR